MVEEKQSFKIVIGAITVSTTTKLLNRISICKQIVPDQKQADQELFVCFFQQWAITQELDVILSFLNLYTLFEKEGRTVTPLLLKIALGESYRYYSAYKHVCICFE